MCPGACVVRCETQSLTTDDERRLGATDDAVEARKNIRVSNRLNTNHFFILIDFFFTREHSIRAFLYLTKRLHIKYRILASHVLYTNVEIKSNPKFSQGSVPSDSK